MSGYLAIIGASGKLGGSTLNALLSNNLVLADNIIVLTSSKSGSSTWSSLQSKGVIVRHATFEHPSTFDQALDGVDRLFLVSSPRIELDYPDAGHGTGREADHVAVIDAAVKAGVQHVYYTSLAFGNPSVAGVMRAHIRTEAYLTSLKDRIQYTILRQGLYNESWPLYLGYFNPQDDDRGEVLLAGDGLISWTGLKDLGIANALILVQPAKALHQKVMYLSAPRSNAYTMAQVAELVSKARQKKTTVATVSVEEHVEEYKKRGMPEDAIRWWVSTYAAVESGETLISDSTLPDLLESHGFSITPMEDTVRAMIQNEKS